MIVGGGVVLAASYEAKAYGVRTAMGGRQARRLCPDAAVVTPRMSAYSEASKAVFEVFEQTTPLVEGLSIDEAFLDVSGLRRVSGEPVDIATTLRGRVRDEVGLAITVGVARTKFLAKVASGVAKPDGLLVVPPDGEMAFLHPLPVERLWGVGPVTARKLHDRGISTVREVAMLPEPALVSMLGQASGRQLHALSHNRDPRSVVVGRRRGSIGSQHALGWSRRTAEDIDAFVVAVVDRVTRRMRAARRVGRTVVLRLRFDDFTRATRSHTVAQATADTRVVLTAARALLDAAQPTIDERGLTCIGVAVTNLADDSRHPARAALRRARRSQRRPRPRPGAGPLRHLVGHPSGAARARPGLLDADAAGLIEGRLVSGWAPGCSAPLRGRRTGAPGRAPRPRAARAAA